MYRWRRLVCVRFFVFQLKKNFPSENLGAGWVIYMQYQVLKKSRVFGNYVTNTNEVGLMVRHCYKRIRKFFQSQSIWAWNSFWMNIWKIYCEPPLLWRLQTFRRLTFVCIMNLVKANSITNKLRVTLGKIAFQKVFFPWRVAAGIVVYMGDSIASEVWACGPDRVRWCSHPRPPNTPSASRVLTAHETSSLNRHSDRIW